MRGGNLQAPVEDRLQNALRADFFVGAGTQTIMVNKPSYHCSYFRWIKLASWLLVVVPTVGALQAGTLSVSWDAVPDSRVSGYKIKYGTVSGNYTQSLSVGKITSATLGGLTNG